MVNTSSQPAKISDQHTANTLPLQNLFLTMTLMEIIDHLFAMSETWIRSDTSSTNLCEITPPGYNIYQQPLLVWPLGAMPLKPEVWPVP